mgnify:CR=1
GQDEELDIAISLWPNLRAHIEQSDVTESDFQASKQALAAIFESK